MKFPIEISTKTLLEKMALVCSVSAPLEYQCGLKLPVSMENLDYRQLRPSMGETFRLAWAMYDLSVTLPKGREILGNSLQDRPWTLNRYHFYPPSPGVTRWVEQWEAVLISPRKGTLQTSNGNVSLEENWTLVLTREPLRTLDGEFTGMIFSTRVWMGWKHQSEPREWTTQTFSGVTEITPECPIKTLDSSRFQRVILKGYYPRKNPQSFSKEDLGVFNWLVNNDIHFDIRNIVYSGPEEDLKPTGRNFGERRVEKRSWSSMELFEAPKTSWTVTVLVIPPQPN